jgi:hypothetical protein
MHAVVKNIASDDVEIDKFKPDDLACFSLSLRIRIGSGEALGADDFDLFVCTPKWLCQNIWEPRWGRHMLIVREYDRSAIETCIYDYVAKCVGDRWHDIAERISRNLSWEFEDYRE